MLPDGLEEVFRVHNKISELPRILECAKRLRDRMETSCKAYLCEDYGDPEHIKGNVFTYRQVLLHRSIHLFEGALHAAVNENPYSMILNIRGHFETTAAIGYFHKQLQSLKDEKITAEMVDKSLCDLMIGSRHKSSLPSASSAKSVLTLLEHADDAAGTADVDENGKSKGVLMESYEYLCEFCHPNFFSNSMALEVNKSVPEFRILHDQPMQDREFAIIGYLSLSGDIFLDLYDQLLSLLV